MLMKNGDFGYTKEKDNGVPKQYYRKREKL